MSIEYTLSIIKPDAVKQNVIGKIYTHFEQANLKIVAAKMLLLTETQAKNFYLVHKDQPFYQNLVKFMISGPIMVQVLCGENAIAKNREIMGATNPQNAKKGTVRYDFGKSIDNNAVHGSDGKETAENEIAFFFTPSEILSEKICHSRN